MFYLVEFRYQNSKVKRKYKYLNQNSFLIKRKNPYEEKSKICCVSIEFHKNLCLKNKRGRLRNAIKNCTY